MACDRCLFGLGRVLWRGLAKEWTTAICPEVAGVVCVFYGLPSGSVAGAVIAGIWLLRFSLLTVLLGTVLALIFSVAGAFAGSYAIDIVVPRVWPLGAWMVLGLLLPVFRLVLRQLSRLRHSQESRATVAEAHRVNGVGPGTGSVSDRAAAVGSGLNEAAA